MSRHSAFVLYTLLSAACSQPAVEQAAAPAPPDTVALRAELQAAADQTEASYLAGDAAGVAATYGDSAIAEYQGFPTAIGRAAIESTFTAWFAANKLSVAEIEVQSVSPVGPDRASAFGTFHMFADAAGKPTHAWWRYVASHNRGADGQWRIGYIMAFVDSTK